MAKRKEKAKVSICEENSPIAIDRPFKVLVITLRSEPHVVLFIGFMMNQSRWFEVTPCPDGIWEIRVKNENRQRIEQICEWVCGPLPLALSKL